MTTSGTVLVALGALAAGFFVCQCRRDVRAEQGYQEADSLRTVNEGLIQTISRVWNEVNARDVTIKALHDTVQFHEDSAAALEHRLQWLLARGRRVDTVWQRGVPIRVDTTADSAAMAATCEERYTLRTVQGVQLQLALNTCKHENREHEANEGTLKRTLSLTTAQFIKTDSTLGWVLNNPPPCRVDIFVAHVKCGYAIAATGMLGLLGGLVAK